MPVIKRYSNRKLYDTEAKQYITLEGIAELIRRGAEIQVVDNDSGQDLTAVTMSQIIFEQERRQSGFLPQTVLTGLVQTGGDTLSTLQRTLVSSVDALRQVDVEIERRVRTLVRRGELAEEDGLRLLDKLLGAEQAHALPWPSQQALARAIERKVPTRADLEKIEQQLQALAAKLERLDRRKK